MNSEQSSELKLEARVPSREIVNYTFCPKSPGTAELLLFNLVKGVQGAHTIFAIIRTLDFKVYQ